METGPVTPEPLVTPAEVRKIDRADGLVRVTCGVQLEAGQVRSHLREGDRTPSGFLRQAAAERIADSLSAVARAILAQRESS